MIWVIVIALCAMLSVGILSWMLVGVFNQALARHQEMFTEQTRVGLSEVFLFLDPAQLWQATFVFSLLIAALVYLVTGSWFFAILLAGVALVIPKRYLKHLKRQRYFKFDAQLPDALLALAGALRAGASVQLALSRLLEEAEAPLSQEFGLLLREQRLGVALDQALQNLASRVPTESSALLVSALRIAAETGGNLAETLERISSTVRSRLHLEGRIRALTSQGKLQAWIVGALPFLLIGVLYRLEPETMSMLWQTPIGWAVLGGIIVLESFGVWWIHKIVNIDV